MQFQDIEQKLAILKLNFTNLRLVLSRWVTINVVLLDEMINCVIGHLQALSPWSDWWMDGHHYYM